MRRSTDGGWLFTRDRAGAGPRATPLARRSEQPRELAPEPAGELRHLARDHLPRLAKRLVDGGEDEVFEHLGIVGRDDLSVDLDGQDLLIAVGLDHDHPTAGRRLHLPLGDLHLQGLDLGLELLRLLHEVAESLHGPSSAPRRGARGPVGRTLVISPSNRSTADLIRGSSGTSVAPAGPGAAAVRTTSRRSGRTRRAAAKTSSRFAGRRSWSWLNALPLGTATVRQFASSATTTAPSRSCPRLGRTRVTSATIRRHVSVASRGGPPLRSPSTGGDTLSSTGAGPAARPSGLRAPEVGVAGPGSLPPLGRPLKGREADGGRSDGGRSGSRTGAGPDRSGPVASPGPPRRSVCRGGAASSLAPGSPAASRSRLSASSSRARMVSIACGSGRWQSLTTATSRSTRGWGGCRISVSASSSPLTRRVNSGASLDPIEPRARSRVVSSAVSPGLPAPVTRTRRACRSTSIASWQSAPRSSPAWAASPIPWSASAARRATRASARAHAA